MGIQFLFGNTVHSENRHPGKLLRDPGKILDFSCPTSVGTLCLVVYPRGLFRGSDVTDKKMPNSKLSHQIKFPISSTF